MSRLHLALAFVAAALAALVPALTAAHEHRELVNGQYEVSIGFIEEPAFVGEKNGLYLRVERVAAETSATPVPGTGEEEHAEGIPVEGLDATLQAEVIYGDQTMPLTLLPAFGQPGVYQSVFFPMAAGDYTFHVFGDIEGNPIDETFTSSPEGFDSVQPREPFEFPKPTS